jgi:hypothetical protein
VTTNGSPTITSMNQSQVKWILDQGADARAFEKPHRDRIDNVKDWLTSVREGYPKNIDKADDHKELMEKMLAVRAELEADRAKYLADYQKWAEAKVEKQWAQDKAKDFEDRNTLLHRRYEHMVNLLDHFHEQVRRKQNPLEIAYEVPDYSKQMAVLEKIHKRNRIIQYTGGTLIATAGTLYGFNFEETNDAISEKYDQLKRWLGGEDKKSPLNDVPDYDPWESRNGLPPLEREYRPNGRNAY